jgi:hypothetical protein
MMEPKERNSAMDSLLEECRACKWGPNEYISINKQLYHAIQECDKRARAWDELEKIANNQWPALKEQMLNLITPTPKDPLEELEKWVIGVWNKDKGFPEWIRKDSLLAEIRRLRVKK